MAEAILDPVQAAAFARANGKPLTDGTVITVPIVRGTAKDTRGGLEVWIDRAGRLVCRELDRGQRPGDGHWWGTEHVGKCQPL